MPTRLKCFRVGGGIYSNVVFEFLLCSFAHEVQIVLQKEQTELRHTFSGESLSLQVYGSAHSWHHLGLCTEGMTNLVDLMSRALLAFSLPSRTVCLFSKLHTILAADHVLLCTVQRMGTVHASQTMTLMQVNTLKNLLPIAL